MQAMSIRRKDMMEVSLLAVLAMVLVSGGEPPDLAYCGAVSSGGVVMEGGPAMIVAQPVAGIASSADYTVRFGMIHCLSASLTLPTSCPADFDNDGTVGASDLAQLLGSWGPCPGCAADFDADGDVDAADLAQLLGSWGPCE